MMTDVNDVEIKVGQKVYDLSRETEIENYGPLDEVKQILPDGVILSNNKKIPWKGCGFHIALAVKNDTRN